MCEITSIGHLGPTNMGEVGIKTSKWDHPKHEISSQANDPTP